MATTTISWGDGSGDNIYLTYPSASGDQSVSVTSDANTGAARSKVVTFSAVGVSPVSLTINQDAGGGGRLPAGYTEYDYLESSMNVKLYTSVSGAATWYLTAQCSTPGTASQILVGYSSNGGCWMGQNLTWGLGSSNRTTIGSGTKSDIVVEFAKPTTTLTIGNETVTRTHNQNFSTCNLFYSGSYYFKGKIFGDVIAKQGGVEVFHGIPCTDPNNVAGYYDTVSHSFKAPASGTLTAGNE